MDGVEHFNCSGIIVLIDMNYFKDINDHYGHIAGDKVLEFTAIHLRKTNADLIRYGGDEFILMFKNEHSEEHVVYVMENNQELMTQKELKFKENSFHAGYAYGIASFQNNDNFQDILSLADTLMYKDKAASKDRLVILKP